MTNSHVQHREIRSKDNNQLFWTKSFLQTSSYDEKRYRQIASNACERIVRKQAILTCKKKNTFSISSYRRRIKNMFSTIQV